MILVTGATGNLGKATIDSLINRGVSPNHISALVRDENKSGELRSRGVQIKLGDYQDPISLESSFQGVDKLLLVSSSSEISERFNQHKNVIDAAKAAGAGHLIYTSFDMIDLQHSIMGEEVAYHARTGDYLKRSAVPYTLMKNTMYADMIPFLIGNDIFSHGISIPAGNGKTPFLPLKEMAEANAVVLTESGHENMEYTIAAETAFSFAEITNMLSAITGAVLSYHQPDEYSYRAQLVRDGVSENDAAYIARFSSAIANGEFQTGKSDVRKLLGRDPVALTDYLTGIYRNIRSTSGI